MFPGYLLDENFGWKGISTPKLTHLVIMPKDFPPKIMQNSIKYRLLFQ